MVAILYSSLRTAKICVFPAVGPFTRPPRANLYGAVTIGSSDNSPVNKPVALMRCRWATVRGSDRGARRIHLRRFGHRGCAAQVKSSTFRKLNQHRVMTAATLPDRFNLSRTLANCRILCYCLRPLSLVCRSSLPFLIWAVLSDTQKTRWTRLVKVPHALIPHTSSSRGSSKMMFLATLAAPALAIFSKILPADLFGQTTFAVEPKAAECVSTGQFHRSLIYFNSTCFSS